MNESPNAMLERAIEIAVVSHAGQVDKNGEAYILHHLRVMLSVRERGDTIEQQAAAVLHDVLEDCGLTDHFLETRFPEYVCNLVDALTRQKDEDYEDFIRRVAKTQGRCLSRKRTLRTTTGDCT